MAVADVQQLSTGIRAGDRRALARAITLIESSRDDHRLVASDLLTRLGSDTGGSIRLGISGVPGVGKSTFIEVFGNHLIDQGKRVAVLAVDPSSPISGGSILGDKTRMETLARNPAAFIRPSPAGGTLGGVASRTQDTLLLCEAAGFDVVIVETVGVGQSEVAVAGMTDMFILLLLPGGGDELQGIKRGVVELADLVLINKADGAMATAASLSAADYQNALQFLQPRTRDWKVPVRTCSALEGKNIDQVWQTVQDYRQLLSTDDALERRRGEQARQWLWKETSERLTSALKRDPGIQARINELEAAVMEQHLPASVAARELIDIFVGPRQRA